MTLPNRVPYIGDHVLYYEYQMVPDSEPVLKAFPAEVTDFTSEGLAVLRVTRNPYRQAPQSDRPAHGAWIFREDALKVQASEGTPRSEKPTEGPSRPSEEVGEKGPKKKEKVV
jgi:hypothetical protein